MKVAVAASMLLVASCARGDVTLLLEEQIGPFWRLNPAHSAIYLSRVCEESPLKLRPCGPGESGVVLSRYHRIDGYDWVAMPLIPYLYSVERSDEVPERVTAEDVSMMREAYRVRHLQGVVGEGEPYKDWPQLVGEAYDRTIYAFRIETSRKQDDDLIGMLNSQPNRNRFNIVFRNCADFAASILDFYYPGSVGRPWIDAGIMTPEHVARSIVQFAHQHSELSFAVSEIRQVPGTIQRSKSSQWLRSLRDVEQGTGPSVVGDDLPQADFPLALPSARG